MHRYNLVNEEIKTIPQKWISRANTSLMMICGGTNKSLIFKQLLILLKLFLRAAKL